MNLIARNAQWTLLLLVSLAACSGERKITRRSPESRPEVRAPDLLTQAIRIEADQTLSLMKSALEKEFLLQSTLLRQDPAVDFVSLRGRVVAFKFSGDQLFLVEATQGHVLESYTAPELVLMRFPILSQNSDSIRFRFTDGMQSLLDSVGFRDGDGNERLYERKQEFNTLTVKIAKPKAASIRNNILILNISTQLEFAPAGESKHVDSMQTHFYLSPYRPNPDFAPLINRRFHGYRFFQSAPQRIDEPAHSVSYALKFDHQKPITYYISSNTPPAFRDAIRKGVEYWRLVDPRLDIRVEIAPAGMTAPDPEHNIIQWVTWDSANFAHADIRSDPRTGEILGTSIFLTSVFARAARNHYIRTSLPLTPAGLEKVAAHYLTATVAHEVGHTLGLAHNLAGSTASTLRPAERKELFLHVANGGELPPPATVSSSLMDYLVLEDNVLLVEHWQKTQQALPHDRKAIAKLYFNEDNPAQKFPYCHDDQLGTLPDCNLFDSGPLMAEGIADRFNTGFLEVQRGTFLAAFLRLKTHPQLQSSLDFAEIDLSEHIEHVFLVDIMGMRKKLLANFTRKANSAKFRSTRPHYSTYDLDENIAQVLDYFQNDYAAAGGFDVPFRILDEKWVAAEVAEFRRLLTPEKLDQYQREYGARFTADEIQIMEKKVRQYYRQLVNVMNEDLFKEIAEMSTPEKPLYTHALNDEWVAWLRAQTFNVLTAVSVDPARPGLAEAIETKVELPKDEAHVKQFVPTAPNFKSGTIDFVRAAPAFRTETRLAAARAMKGLYLELPLRSQDEFAELRKEMACHYDAIFSNHRFDQLDIRKASSEFQKWYFYEKNIADVILE